MAGRKKDPGGVPVHNSGFGRPNYPLNRPLTTDYAYEDTRDPAGLVHNNSELRPGKARPRNGRA